MNFLVNLTMLYFLIASTEEEDKIVIDKLEKRRAARGLYRRPKLDLIEEKPVLEDEMDKESKNCKTNHITYDQGKGLMKMTFDENLYFSYDDYIIEEEDSENIDLLDKDVSEIKNSIEKTTKNNFNNIKGISEDKSILFAGKNNRQILKERNGVTKKRDNSLMNNLRNCRSSIRAF